MSGDLEKRVDELERVLLTELPVECRGLFRMGYAIAEMPTVAPQIAQLIVRTNVDRIELELRVNASIIVWRRVVFIRGQ